MKKKYINKISCYCLTCAFVLAMLVTACTDEEVVNGKENMPEGDGVGIFQLKIGLSSMTDTEDLESRINKVRIIAFSSNDGGVKLNEVYPNDKNHNPANILQEIKTGYTDVCIIVNETPSMTVGLSAPDIKKDNIRQQLLSHEDFSLFANQDSLAKYGIPMYEECDRKLVTVDNIQSNPLSLNVEVKRILAKLTLRIANTTHSKDVRLDSVKVQSLPQLSWLYPQQYSAETISANAITLKPNANKSKYDDVSLYIPEYQISVLSKRSYLNIWGVAQTGVSAMDTIHCYYRITLGNGMSGFNKEAMVEKALTEGKLTAEDFNIVRNTHYEIDVTDIKGYEGDKLTFVVGVAPWINVKEDAYEGGVWRKQPISSRIPIYGGTSFSAKFMHTQAPYIVYKWYRSQYEQTITDKEPAKPTIQLLQTDVLKNGLESTYTFEDALPTASGEIYCEAAPIGGQHFRESNRVTLMVVGDWDGKNEKGEEQDIFPDIQNWKPKGDMPLGASYLLRDTRDNKIYRTKRMADGNWWMIQELSYGDTCSVEDFWDFGATHRRPVDFIGSQLYGVACTTTSDFGGYLYNSYAATQKESTWPTSEVTSLQISLVQGLCPLGWHLPGNLDGHTNIEWRTFQDALSDDFSLSLLRRFDYYTPSHFNCYSTNFFDSNDGKIKDSSKVIFPGGINYRGGRFCSYGFLYEEESSSLYKGSIYQELIDNDKSSSIDIVIPEDGAPIRCIRDYTK